MTVDGTLAEYHPAGKKDFVEIVSPLATVFSADWIFQLSRKNSFEVRVG